jgi:hypothetical protein
LPSSTWCSGLGQGKVSCTLTLESGVLVLSSPQSMAQQHTDVASELCYEASIEL